MLTKNDLLAISNLIASGILPLNSKIDSLATQLKPIKRDINRMKKDISYMVKTFDNADISLNRRVSRIEEHLGLPNAS